MIPQICLGIHLGIQTMVCSLWNQSSAYISRNDRTFCHALYSACCPWTILAFMPCSKVYEPCISSENVFWDQMKLIFIKEIFAIYICHSSMSDDIILSWKYNDDWRICHSLMRDDRQQSLDNFCCFVCMSLTTRTSIHMLQHCFWWCLHVLMWELCIFCHFCSVLRSVLLFLRSISRTLHRFCYSNESSWKSIAIHVWCCYRIAICRGDLCSENIHDWKHDPHW